MDNSEILMKMCEKATEIQKKWIPSGDDVYLERDATDPDNDHLRNLEINDQNLCSSSIVNSIKKTGIWLPRQDQLQEMIAKDGKCDCLDCLVSGLHNFHYSHTRPPNFTSMEQLWLAFVMKEKYGKRWDGADWVLASKDT